MVSLVKLRRVAYITSVTGAVGTSLCASALLRKVHKDALEYVNSRRVRDGQAPIEDFPTGWRDPEALSPVGKVVDMRAVDDDLSVDDSDFVVKAIIGGYAESVVMWHSLFLAGFYPRYKEGRLYTRLPPSRVRRFLSAVKDKPTDWQESYLRTKALISHVRRELPIKT